MVVNIEFAKQTFEEMGTFAFQASDLDGAIPIQELYPDNAPDDEIEGHHEF